MTLTMSKISRPPVCSEQVLVAATRAGDDRAYEELYARYRERIFSFIQSKVHDHGRAEDIAQDVFMSALRRLRANDQSIAFKPWIYEIAKNACIDEFRRGSRTCEVPLESDGEIVVDRQAAALSAVPTPPAAVESKQRLNDLRGAFGGLSASQHQLLVMREFEGLSYDEIGERLNMTRQMVESGLFRARRKLSEEYQELASGQRCQQIQTAIDDGRLRSVSALGLRDRRRFARHLSHCQPCRHVALMAGVDEALVKPRSIAAKIAALLPFPLWRLFPWRSGGTKAASRAGGSHQMAGAASAGLAQSAGSALTLGQAAATVAVIVAGAGGGLAVNSLASSGHQHAPAAANAADHSARQGSAASAGSAGSAVGSTAAPARGALTSRAPGALSFASSTQTTRQPATTPRRQRGSSSGAPGTGGSGGSGGSGGTDGSGGSNAATGKSGSSSSAAANRTVNGVTNAAGKTVNGVTNTVGKTVNGVTNTVGKTVNGVTNTVGKTVNGVTNTAGSAVNGVTNTVGKTVNGVTQATGTATTPVGQAVNGATSTVGQAVGGATNGVSQTANGATGAVGNTVNGVTGAVGKTVNGVTGGLTPKATGGATGGLTPKATGGATGGSSGSSASSPTSTAASGVQQAGSVLGK
jgi:RNA polymerase sigma factor (sigma-70 family)